MADLYTDEHLAMSVNYRASDDNLFGSNSRRVTYQRLGGFGEVSGGPECASSRWVKCRTIALNLVLHKGSKVPQGNLALGDGPTYRAHVVDLVYRVHLLDCGRQFRINAEFF
jgi:hypothetical protein